jgi:phage portal protein BeeE
MPTPRPPSLMRPGFHRRSHERASEYRPLPDRDGLYEEGIIGTGNSPIIKPSDWPGWDGIEDFHLHGPADSTRPTGWATPPMQPDGGGGGYNRYFFDGSTGAAPFDIFAAGWKDPEMFMSRIGVVQTAIAACADVLSSMPVYGATKRSAQVELPSWRHSPNKATYPSWSAFMEQLVSQYLSRGEVFLWALSRYADTGYPREFVILNPAWVNVTSDGNGGWNYYLGDDKLVDEDVLHIKQHSVPSEAHGYGALAWMARSVAGAETLNSYVENVARFGTPAIITSPASLDARGARELKAKWLESRSIPGQPAVLSGGLTYQDGGGGLSPADMAAAAMISSTEAKLIAAICATPPIVCGVESPGGNLFYQTLSGMTSAWWRIGLRPAANRLMSAMSGWLLPSAGTWMELNRDDFIRSADPLQNVQALATAINTRDEEGFPLMTINEARVIERRDIHEDATTPGSRTDKPVEDRFLDARALSGDD